MIYLLSATYLAFHCIVVGHYILAYFCMWYP